MPHKPILNVENLNIGINKHDHVVPIIKNLSFNLLPKETHALVGESGSGKTVFANSLIGIFRSHSLTIQSGSIQFNDQNLLSLKKSDLIKIRGKQISYIPQNPQSSLNPTLSIGVQLVETIDPARNISKREAWELAHTMLKLVRIPESWKRLKSYPHELSGGMRQRVLIAMALINQPKIVIADEPTTALDVTVQAQILDLLQELQEQVGMSLLFITHDLGIVAKISHRVSVMYAGEIVETGPVQEIFTSPKHPYTQGLLQSVPKYTERNQKLFYIPGIPQSCSTDNSCPFAPRCPFTMRACIEQSPPVVYLNTPKHMARCFHLLLEQKKDH